LTARKPADETLAMAKTDLPEQLRKRIEDQISGHDTVLYMKGTKLTPQCRYSGRVVEILKTLGVPFSTVDVLADDEIREGIKTYNDWPTIPQLYHKGEFIGGCGDVDELFESGELQEKLGVAAAK
jgi:monothiol glutaredoxin